MHLNLFTDYAYRLLIHVATMDPEIVTIAQAAKSYGISRNHLTKVANELVRGGFLESLRGRGGGLYLARKPEDINLGDVFRYCETDTPLVECFNKKTNTCVITTACRLKHVLHGANKAFQEELSKATLADMIDRKSELQKLLS